jgi:hypothetical protein
MIRYANDLNLTDLARKITKQIGDLNSCLRDGHLESAYHIAEWTEEDLEMLRWRLNDLKFGRAK